MILGYEAVTYHFWLSGQIPPEMNPTHQNAGHFLVFMD